MLAKIIILFLFDITLFANPYGNELQLFFPNFDGVDFLSVESGNTLKERQLNLGFFIDRSTNTLPRRLEEGSSVNDSKKLSNVLDDIYHATLTASYGYSDQLNFGAQFNVSSKSNVKSEEDLIYEQNAGLNDVFLHLKTKFIDTEHIKSSFTLGLGRDTLSNNPYFDQSRPFYYSSTLAFSIETKLIKWALNAGYKHREIVEAPAASQVEIPPMSEKYFFSSGLSIGRGFTRVILEANHSTTRQRYEQQSDRVEEASETTIGVKFSSENHSIYFANSTEIKHGLSTADNRLMLGYRYHPILEKKQAPAIDEKVDVKIDEPIEESSPVPELAVKPEVEKIVQEVVSKQVPEAPAVEPELASVLENIRFADGSSTILLDAKTREALSRIQAYLKDKKPPEILITGHTDNRGRRDMNLKLSLSRAQAVKMYLRARGFSNVKITAMGMGEARPIADNKDQEGRDKNTRIEIDAYKKVILSH